MTDNETPTISLSSIRDAIVEGWNLSLDLLGSLVMPDFDITTLEDDDDGL
jgi:hypothetical protein